MTKYNLANPDGPRTLHIEMRDKDGFLVFVCRRTYDEKKVFIENEHPTHRCCMHCAGIELAETMRELGVEIDMSRVKTEKLEAEVKQLEADIAEKQRRLRALGEKPS